MFGHDAFHKWQMIGLAMPRPVDKSMSRREKSYCDYHLNVQC